MNMRSIDDNIIYMGRDLTKISVTELLSPSTRFEASDWNTTVQPSREMEGNMLRPLDWEDWLETDALRVTLSSMSLTKTSMARFESLAMRLDADDPNETY